MPVASAAGVHPGVSRETPEPCSNSTTSTITLRGGENEASNLVTLCNVHHDDVHRLKLETDSSFEGWLEARGAT